MRFPLFAAVLSLLAVLTGCGGPRAPQPPSTANSHFELVVDWATVDNAESQHLLASAVDSPRPVARAQAGDFSQPNVGYHLPATHVGVRLEYQDKNRVFFESLERTAGDPRVAFSYPKCLKAGSASSLQRFTRAEAKSTGGVSHCGTEYCRICKSRAGP